MRIIADFHIHSRYSRASSGRMVLEEIERSAQKKGLNLVGTGDFTHPAWFSELKRLRRDGDFYTLTGRCLFVPTAEVSLVYEKEGRPRKIHIVLIAPDLEAAEQVSSELSGYGDLSSDGRPTLSLTSPELVDICLSVSPDILVIPAHAWTPWFSVFGSRSGFDSLRECFEDRTGKIHAIETGLSSDPEMNWRVSELDRVALVSNSDSHSPNLWRLGREANVFELREPSYRELVKVIKTRDPRRFLFTVEVDPAYGKYHLDGHRKCGVRMEPEEAEKFGNRCPVCGKQLTLGVLHRVEELADRPPGFVPEGAIPFRRMLPLYELVSVALGINRLYSGRVERVQNELIGRFGSEFSVLLDADPREVERAAGPEVAEFIVLNREGRIPVSPGFDGVYGEIATGKPENFRNPQKRITDY